MRKEGGSPQFVGPANSKALSQEIEELGGQALTQFHISDELDSR